MQIEDESLAAIQPAGPQIATIISQPGLMRLVTARHRQAMYDSAIGFRSRIGADGHELVLFIANARHTRGPDIGKILLAGNPGQIGGVGGFVGASRAQIEPEQ